MHALIFPEANYNYCPGHLCEIHPFGPCPVLLWGMGTTAPQSPSCFRTLGHKYNLLDESVEQMRSTAAKSSWCGAAATGLFVWAEGTISPAVITWTHLGTSSTPAPLSYTCICPPRLVSPPLWFSWCSVKGKTTEKCTSKGLFPKTM